jgi:hypothetical protein
MSKASCDLAGRSLCTASRPDGAKLGARALNPLILGPLFRLVVDRCSDLAFSRSQTFVVCGRFALSGCH